MTNEESGKWRDLVPSVEQNPQNKQQQERQKNNVSFEAYFLLLENTPDRPSG
jgi:hypothetical protein